MKFSSLSCFFLILFNLLQTYLQGRLIRQPASQVAGTTAPAVRPSGSIIVAVLLGDFHDSCVAEEASLAVEKVPGYAAITRNMGARRKSSICLIRVAYAADCAVISFLLCSPHALLEGLQLSLTD